MAIVFISCLENEEVQHWVEQLSQALPEEQVAAWDDGLLVENFDIAIVANPPKGQLAKLTELRFIQSAWAGIDGLLLDDELPEVPIARLVDPTLASDMAEGVLGYVMALHRQAYAYGRQQLSSEWRPLSQPRASERTVGILGMGEMGTTAARLLRTVGFNVLGWSRSGKSPIEVEMLSGSSGLDQLLKRTEILVNLLPLTPATTGILDATALSKLPRGACVINVGRGGHIVTEDLLAALDSGAISHAILDVFEVEPLPVESRLWLHECTTITPHVAAPTDVVSAVRQIADNVRRYRNDETIVGLVNRSAGY